MAEELSRGSKAIHTIIVKDLQPVEAGICWLYSTRGVPLPYTEEEQKILKDAQEREVRRVVDATLPEFLARLNKPTRKKALEYTIEKLQAELANEE